MAERNQFTERLEHEMSRFGQVKTFPAGSVILSEASYIQALPIVLKGSPRVMRMDEDGREILLYYIQPGESCIMSFLGGLHQETSKVRAIVEEDAEILFVPVDKTSAWLKEFPEWTDYIFKLYHKRFEELLEVVNGIVFKRLDERILQLLRQKSEVLKSREIKITHQQLAQEVGSTREVVSRIVKTMEQNGLLQLSRNKITLK